MYSPSLPSISPPLSSPFYYELSKNIQTYGRSSCSPTLRLVPPPTPKIFICTTLYITLTECCHLCWHYQFSLSSPFSMLNDLSQFFSKLSMCVHVCRWPHLDQMITLALCSCLNLPDQSIIMILPMVLVAVVSMSIDTQTRNL